MNLRFRLALALLLALVGVTVGVRAVLAQEAPATGAASPRQLFDDFFRAVNDEVGRGQKGRLDDAAALLDLTGVEDLLGTDRDEGARRLALRLKEVLDYHGRIDPADLPGQEFPGDLFVLQTEQGQVLAHRRQGVWLFHPDSLRDLDRMRTAFESSGAQKYEQKTLRHLVPESLRRRALFLEHWQWLGVVCLLIACWIGDRILVFFVRQVLAAVLRRKHWLAGAAQAADLASRPLGLFAVAAMIWFAHPYLDLPSREFGILAKFFASLGAVLVLYRMSDVVAARLREMAEGTESKLDDQLVPLVRRSLKLLVSVGGVLFILDNLNVNVWSLITGLGIFGIGVGLAAQDTMKNLFGSFTVFTDRPFQVGDWVIMAGTEGTVEEVGFRSTRVRTFYNSVVSVPNAKLVDGIVDNMGRRQYRRFKTLVGVQYDTPPERIEAFCAGIRDIVLANPDMRHDSLEVYLNDFGPSSLNILVYVFFSVPDWDSELRARQNFMLEVMRLAKALGVEFAFPTQTLHLASTPERPLPEHEQPPIDELDAIRIRFAKGGDASRPGGTPRWSTAKPPE